MYRPIVTGIVIAAGAFATGTALAQSADAQLIEEARRAAKAARNTALGQGADAPWIDATPIGNWNKAGGAVPRGPRVDREALEYIRECESAEKPAAPTPETEQVAAAGWKGAMVEKRAGDTVYVLARNGVDAQCRPIAYQLFIFVGGRFAGTVAPQPMYSRTDSGGFLKSTEAGRFTVDFPRYGADDPYCCPSRFSTVTYEIRQVPGGPLVVPTVAATAASRE